MYSEPSRTSKMYLEPSQTEIYLEQGCREQGCRDDLEQGCRDVFRTQSNI